MSRTTRNNPVYLAKRNGEFRDWWDDNDDWCHHHYYRRTKEVPTGEVTLRREFFDKILPNGQHTTYFKMVPVKETYEVFDRWAKSWSVANYELVECFDKKSPEGPAGKGRSYQGGIGKYNKRLRKKHHRAQVHSVIQGHYMRGDFDAEIPRERNHDGDDWW